MEQSELSSLIAKLKIAYPGYFKGFSQMEIIAMVNLYDEQLKEYPYQVVAKVIDNIISNSKFMPAVSEIKKACDNFISKYEFEILKKMYDDGYFHKGYEELSSEQASRNYEKANMWLSKGIIPEWLLKDMQSYGYKAMLKNSNVPLLAIEE